MRSRCRQHLFVKKHLITINSQQSQNFEPIWSSLTIFSPNTISDDACDTVTFILYLWSFLFTVLKSASYHKFGSKETKSFTTVLLSIAILSRRLFSNTMHSKQKKGIFIFRMLSLSIVWDTCNRGKHNRNYRNIRNQVIFRDSR